MPQAPSSLGLLGVGLALLSSTPVAWALGMGNVKNNTLLGSPLNISVPVLGVADEKPPTSDCVKVEVLAGEGRLPAKLVHARVEPGKGEGLYQVRVTSDIRITEPVVTVSLGLGCEAPLTRQFVLFVDPPSLPVGSGPLVLPAGEGPVATAASPSSVHSAAVPVSTPLQPSQPASRAATGRQRARVASSAASVPGEQPPQPRVTARAATPRGGSKPAAAKPPSGPRLTLEAPTEPVAPPAPVVSEPSSEDVALAKQLALLTELEGVLKQVSAENKAVQENMSALQLKLRNAELALQKERERQREQPPIVWVLAGVVGLLTLTLLVVLWRQRRRPPVPFYQRSSVFGDGPQGRAEPPVLDSMPSHLQPLESVASEDGRVSAFVQAEAEPAAVPTVAVPAATAVAVPAAAAPAVTANPAVAAPPPSSREVAVEELIDLEQQADFFIALGQDQEAIELLTSHMNGASSASPLPYLKLIDIYRRRGDRMAYEQTRLRFHRRFTARIPDWNAPQGAERALEEYGEIMRVLEACWAVPKEAMKRLESLLFRKEGQGNTFDLTAYRDLLMLYAVARDLQAQGMQGVDLEL